MIKTPTGWSLKITTTINPQTRGRREEGLAIFFFIKWSLHFEECFFIVCCFHFGPIF
jgi:hypothetical protein